jgi:hypothetical protein
MRNLLFVFSMRLSRRGAGSRTCLQFFIAAAATAPLGKAGSDKIGRFSARDVNFLNFEV